MKLSFGDVHLDSGTRELRRGAVDVHLTRKAFELLGFLLERRPNAVSKQEIHSRLWPDTFVSEATLQSLVFELRDAIGDDARKPRFIRTVHGFGYAFSGSVMESVSQDPARRVRGWLIGEVGRLPLFEGENVLGREGKDVIEVGSATVSRRHACISLTDTPTLEDLGSKNGTFVGEQQISSGKVPLADGDRVRLGSVLLTFRLASAENGSTLTARAPDPPGDRSA